jgi:hypothetical protein
MKKKPEDVAQVCQNGHLIVGSIKSHPDFQSPFCEQCGAGTMSACQKCEWPIRGIGPHAWIPTDRIRIPEVDPIQPYQDEVALALHSRPEMATQRINVENNKINARGSRAELLPTLNAFVTLDNNALAGAANVVQNPNGTSTFTNRTANPYFIGGAGNLLGQVFARNFPDYVVGLNLSIPIRNPRS